MVLVVSLEPFDKIAATIAQAFFSGKTEKNGGHVPQYLAIS